MKYIRATALGVGAPPHLRMTASPPDSSVIHGSYGRRLPRCLSRRSAPAAGEPTANGACEMGAAPGAEEDRRREIAPLVTQQTRPRLRRCWRRQRNGKNVKRRAADGGPARIKRKEEPSGGDCEIAGSAGRARNF